MLIMVAKYQTFLWSGNTAKASTQIIVEGGIPIYYYFNGALDCESNESQPTRDDKPSDFYPEVCELSPKDMESMFNDFILTKQ